MGYSSRFEAATGPLEDPEKGKSSYPKGSSCFLTVVLVLSMVEPPRFPWDGPLLHARFPRVFTKELWEPMNDPRVLG